jgi:hypothetical protein
MIEGLFVGFQTCIDASERKAQIAVERCDARKDAVILRFAQRVSGVLQSFDPFRMSIHDAQCRRDANP